MGNHTDPGHDTRRTLIDRRTFLGVSSAVVASAMVPRLSSGVTSSARTDVDVVVIGAGISGLVAARRLIDGGVDAVVVLEARDRVGGRTINVDIGNGHVAEGGGEWLGPQQTYLHALADELGIGTFPSFVDGDIIFNYDGTPTRGQAPPLPPLAIATYWALTRVLNGYAQSIPVSNPWDAPDARRWDSQTFAEWLDRNVDSAGARLLLEFDVASILGPADNVSMLWLLFYVKSAGNWETLQRFSGGAQESRFIGGSQLVSIRLAQTMASSVRLDAPVTRLRNLAPNRVVVDSAVGSISARRVVVAMMPKDVTRIRFEPALPPQRQLLNRGWGVEGGIKTNIVYDEPFWRDDGLSGLLQSVVPPVSVTVDNSPPDGSRGVLGVFMGDAISNRNVRREIVLRELAYYYGPRARRPLRYIETNWNADPWARGCVSPNPVGLTTAAGAALREPVGHVHWAGTETSEIWCGYMEGAVRAGVRVAAEVIDSLG